MTIQEFKGLILRDIPQEMLDEICDDEKGMIDIGDILIEKMKYESFGCEYHVVFDSDCNLPEGEIFFFLDDDIYRSWYFKDDGKTKWIFNREPGKSLLDSNLSKVKYYEFVSACADKISELHAETEKQLRGINMGAYYLGCKEKSDE